VIGGYEHIVAGCLRLPTPLWSWLGVLYALSLPRLLRFHTCACSTMLCSLRSRGPFISISGGPDRSSKFFALTAFRCMDNYKHGCLSSSGAHQPPSISTIRHRTVLSRWSTHGSARNLPQSTQHEKGNYNNALLNLFFKQHLYALPGEKYLEQPTGPVVGCKSVPKD
jgi:hypothetical protein